MIILISIGLATTFAQANKTTAVRRPQAEKRRRQTTCACAAKVRGKHNLTSIIAQPSQEAIAAVDTRMSLPGRLATVFRLYYTVSDRQVQRVSLATYEHRAILIWDNLSQLLFPPAAKIGGI